VEGRLDRRERRQDPAREDVGLDPVRPAQLRPVRDVRKRDHLEAQPPAWPQGPIAGPEERGVVLGADGLEHLDRDDGVIGADDVAVVSQLDADPVGEAGRPDPFRRQVVLGRRDRHGGHATPELARGIQREAAPAAADLEHVLAADEARALRHHRVFATLGVGQRNVGRVEDRTRVGQRLVEEQPVEVVPRS
jgi:hypothetical protein